MSASGQLHRDGSITGVDGQEITPGIWLVGNIGWNADAKQWRCLANVDGCLALIEVKPTFPKEFKP